MINQLILCDKCGKALASVPTYHPGTTLTAERVHASRFVAMVLRPGDSSGHPAGSWFVRADCPTCHLGGGCLYIPQPAPLSFWERVRRRLG